MSAKGGKKNSEVEINSEHLENCAKPYNVHHPDCLIYSCVGRGSNLRFLKTFDGKQDGLCLLLFRDCCVVIWKYVCGPWGLQSVNTRFP